MRQEFIFLSPANGIFTDWNIKHNFCLFLQQTMSSAERFFKCWAAGNFDDACLGMSDKFSPRIIGVSVTVQGDNPLDSFFGIEFYRIGNGSRTNTICFSRLFMGKNFTMDVSKSIRIWHLFRTVFV